MEVASGENPVVNGSGESENALRNPCLLSCRKIRMIKASVEVATILSEVQYNASIGLEELVYLSA